MGPTDNNRTAQSAPLNGAILIADRNSPAVQVNMCSQMVVTQSDSPVIFRKCKSLQIRLRRLLPIDSTTTYNVTFSINVYSWLALETNYQCIPMELPYM